MCSVIYLKACLHNTEAFRKTSDGAWVCYLFLCNNRQHMPVGAKMISSWVRKIWVLQRLICLLLPSIMLQSWQLLFPWCSSYRLVTGPKFLPQPDIIFYQHHYYQLAPGFDNDLYKVWHICWAVPLPSTEQIVS